MSVTPPAARSINLIVPIGAKLEPIRQNADTQQCLRKRMVGPYAHRLLNRW